MIQFDHIEIHVKNSNKYILFLHKLFNGGRSKKISENNTYMFLTPDSIRFEIKESINNSSSFDINKNIGFCLPCLRMKDAKSHLETIKEVKFKKTIVNPDGHCYFFTDHEEIYWHFKDYEILDIYTNI